MIFKEKQIWHMILHFGHKNLQIQGVLVISPWYVTTPFNTPLLCILQQHTIYLNNTQHTQKKNNKRLTPISQNTIRFNKCYKFYHPQCHTPKLSNTTKSLIKTQDRNNSDPRSIAVQRLFLFVGEFLCCCHTKHGKTSLEGLKEVFSLDCASLIQNPTLLRPE